MEKINSFYRLVTEFCNYFKENEITNDAIDYLITSLMKLYIAALELPLIDPETDEVRDTQKCSIKIDRKLKTTYWEVFDPWEEETPIRGNLYDDFSDIVKDLQRGIEEYDLGRIGNAVFEWRFGVTNHWGDHTVNTIRALHWLRYR